MAALLPRLPPSALPRPGVQRLLPVLLLGAALLWTLLLYRDTASAIVLIWSRSETFAHGYIVVPIVLWLVWRQRQAVAAQPWRAAPLWLLPVAAVAALWLLGSVASVNAVTQTALAALLVLAVPALLGVAAARQILFPLAFLFFAVPLGEFLMPRLMEGTADFTVYALRLSGIPVYREGLQFVIPTGNWSVVEACSGVRYLIASFMVGTLFAYLNYRTARRRALFMAVAVAVPVLANWVRAYLIVLLGHLSGNTVATGVDHLIYGWAFFGVVITLMFVIGARFAERDEAVAPVAPASVVGATAHGVGSPRAVALTAALLALLLAAPHWARSALAGAQDTSTPALAAPAALAADWRLAAQPVADWQPAFQGPAAHFNHSYVNGAASGASAVGLYIGYYRNQQPGRKLVSSDNAFVKSTDKQWARVSSGGREVALGARNITVEAAELRRLDMPAGENRLRVWKLYWVQGRLTASDAKATAWGAVNTLLGRGDDGAVVILYTKQQPAGAADALLGAFMKANLAPIEEMLEKQLQSARQPQAVSVSIKGESK